MPRPCDPPSGCQGAWLHEQVAAGMNSIGILTGGGMGRLLAQVRDHGENKIAGKNALFLSKVVAEKSR